MRSQEDRGKLGKMDSWTGDSIWVKQRPGVVKKARFLVEERLKLWTDARREKRLAILPLPASSLKSGLQQRARIWSNLG